MNLELRGKVALVTGASRGIGRAIAIGLAGEGARLALTARTAADLDTAASAAKSAGAQDVAVLAADLSRLDEVERVVNATVDRFGRIDVLVNNAGAIRGGDFLKIPDQQWIDDWSLKLLGYIRMARAVFPVMQRQGGGRICNVVGAAARNPTPTYLTGGAANAALVNFTKGLADLGARSGILVTAVSPAATRTSRWDALMAQQAAASGRSADEMIAEAERAYPLGRIGRPEDVADLVCFLVSARASFLTGTCITVDGGSSRGVYP
ncbi:MAG: SDR family oxidoreductase [Candidatus Rokubacteria bacterium]|nr:SDR family oxidoreductase [Candidatus Rokubacteria bacterium]